MASLRGQEIPLFQHLNSGAPTFVHHRTQDPALQEKEQEFEHDSKDWLWRRQQSTYEAQRMAGLQMGAGVGFGLLQSVNMRQQADPVDNLDQVVVGMGQGQDVVIVDELPLVMEEEPQQITELPESRQQLPIIKIAGADAEEEEDSKSKKKRNIITWSVVIFSVVVCAVVIVALLIKMKGGVAGLRKFVGRKQLLAGNTEVGNQLPTATVAAVETGGDDFVANGNAALFGSKEPAGFLNQQQHMSNNSELVAPQIDGSASLPQLARPKNFRRRTLRDIMANMIEE